MPRIIAGSRKKMLLKTPPGKTTRPTADRVKESLFNIISEDISGCCFLDLFAGTGQMGLEAVSRDASFCMFVEKDTKVFKVLCENISKCGFENVECIRSDSLAFLDNSKRKYDIIYIDPPYASGIYDRILDKIDKKDLLLQDGKILVEHDFNIEICGNYGILIKYREERYGNTKITFFKKRD
jgi:16S rRNA (guanine966-N2)-methyltransferase